MATGIEDHGIACITRLIGQLVPFRSLPERLGIRFWETRLGSWCCHGLVSPDLSACDRWAQSAARIVTAVAWREPSWPPLPTATASLASLTWDVDSPRSCRVASSSKKRPRCPGWFDDRPPPSVFNAGLRGSSKTRWPSPTYCPPSPFLQKPRSSMRHMTVMEKESYAINTSISAGLTPASPKAIGAAWAPALTVMSPPFSRYLVASPVPMIHTGFLRQLRAAAADAMTTAPPPSETIQHSSKRRG